MSVVDRGKIDFLYNEDEFAVIEILDHLIWEHDALIAHWQMLQDKLKDYIGFIYSGQLKEMFPEKEYKPRIRICFVEQWPEIVEKHLLRQKEYYKELGVDLAWQLEQTKES